MQKVPCYQSRTVTVDVDQTNEFPTQPASFELESHPSKSNSVSNTCTCKLNGAPFKIPIQNCSVFCSALIMYMHRHIYTTVWRLHSLVYFQVCWITWVQESRWYSIGSKSWISVVILQEILFVIQESLWWEKWLPWLWQLDWECPWTFAAEIQNMGHLQCRWNKFVL